MKSKSRYTGKHNCHGIGGGKLPAFRDKFRSSVQRLVFVRLHDFHFFRNAQVASPHGNLAGGPFDVERDGITF